MLRLLTSHYTGIELLPLVIGQVDTDCLTPSELKLLTLARYIFSVTQERRSTPSPIVKTQGLRLTPAAKLDIEIAENSYDKSKLLSL